MPGVLLGVDGAARPPRQDQYGLKVTSLGGRARGSRGRWGRGYCRVGSGQRGRAHWGRGWSRKRGQRRPVPHVREAALTAGSSVPQERSRLTEPRSPEYHSSPSACRSFQWPRTRTSPFRTCPTASSPPQAT